jgi:hypothetical protein
MRTLSRDEAARVFKTSDIGAFFGSVDWQYPDPVPSYFLPKNLASDVGTYLDKLMESPETQS